MTTNTDTTFTTTLLGALPDALPEGWLLVRLVDAYSFTKKPRGLDIRFYSAIPFVPMEIIPIGIEYFEQYELRSSDEISSGTYFEPGDILLSKITPSFENGKQGIIEHLPTPFGYATTEVIPIKAVPERSDQLYLFYYLLRHSRHYRKLMIHSLGARKRVWKGETDAATVCGDGG